MLEPYNEASWWHCYAVAGCFSGLIRDHYCLRGKGIFPDDSTSYTQGLTGWFDEDENNLSNALVIVVTRSQLNYTLRGDFGLF